jgi:uncharacterized membrane protein YoaK (UPF0700 family)
MHDTAGRTSIRSQTRAEESLLVAILLSLAGGFLDAFTWIAHDGVMANAQTANVVLFGVYGATGEWTQALRHLPPIAAFMLGVLAVCWVRSAPFARNGRALARFSLIVEIVLLVGIMILHVRIPSIAGTLGISFAAAVQTTSFAKIEGRAYSSVMVTGNLRRVVEGLHAGWTGHGDHDAPRQALVLFLVCVTFAAGAGLGALVTTGAGGRALIVPILLLLAALILCHRGVPVARSATLSER